MEYVFFDIECSEGRSICSFGYVVTDAVFNIVEKRDILINPQSFFHTGPWSKKAESEDNGITLAYPIEEFRSQPPFPAFYDVIKEVLTAKDRRVVGFSNDNDARFINYACQRYHMPYFDYCFYDVQRIFQDLLEQKNQLALEKVIAYCEIDTADLVAHKSSDDAHLTMLVAEALCKKSSKTLETLVKEHPRAIGQARNYMPKKKKAKPQAKNAKSNMQSKAVGQKKNGTNAPKSNGSKQSEVKRSQQSARRSSKKTSGLAHYDRQKRPSVNQGTQV